MKLQQAGPAERGNCVCFHCSEYFGYRLSWAGPEADALIFPGAKGGPLRRSNFNKMSAWAHAAQTIGAYGLHFHDLRHTSNHFAAASQRRKPQGSDGADGP